MRFQILTVASMILPCLVGQAFADRDADWKMAARIDELFESAWQEQGIQPAELSSDAEFLRRASLDLTGVIPTVGNARAFLDSSSDDNRRELVERLLASPRFPTHLANTFRNVILPSENNNNPFANSDGLQSWLRQQFVKNLRYDRIVSEFIAAQGNDQDGPAIFYRSLEAKPEKLAASTARVFLGLQIQCAQCHDHPFDDWSQEEFWQYAAFFAQLQAPGNNMAQFELVDLDTGEVSLPDSDEPVAPKYPRGRMADAKEGGSRRIQLSIWMASRDNPFLATAAVNRVWAIMFGKGLIDPVDDIGPHNPAAHPEVMKELTEYFVAKGFDVRSLFRVIANSRVYQRTSQQNGDAAEPQLFEHIYVKTMTPDQLFDSLSQAFLQPSLAADGRVRSEFARQMGAATPDRTEYSAGIQQALNMMNGGQVIGATGPNSTGILSAIETPWLNDSEKINSLVLAALTRFPNEQERNVFSEYLSKSSSSDERRQALGDIMWALVNSAEFQLNH